MKTGFIDVLSEEQVKLTSEYIDLFQDYWVPRGIYCKTNGFSEDPSNPIDFYTIGAVTYIDGLVDLNDYYRYSKSINPTLLEYFGWLYSIVLDKLQENIGPCEMLDFLGHPGFHIFGHKPGKEVTPQTIEYMKKPLATIHKDLQQDKHIKVWEYYKEFDLEDCLSFTLAIEVPKSGAGLNTWNEPSLEKYDRNDEFSKELKTLDYGEYGPPTAVVPYEPGKMFYFIGKLLHQIAPVVEDTDPNDRRITLQGHGVKCDGIWKIYF